MKKKAAFILLLILCFSSQLSSEALNCEQSFELGRINAKEEYKTWAWYFFGIGKGLSDVLLWLWADSSWDTYWNEHVPHIAIALDVAVLIPAFICPLRSGIFPSSIDVDLECYRDSYKRRTTWKNYGTFLLGEFTILAPIGVLFLVYACLLM